MHRSGSSFFRSSRALRVAALLLGVAGISSQAQTVGNSSSSWQGYDWLKAPEQQQNQATTSTTTTTGQDGKDPFSVLSTGALWQEKVASVYTHQVNDSLVLSYATTSTLFTESSIALLPLAGGTPDDLSREQKASMQFQLSDDVTLSSNVHQSSTDTTPGAAPITSGGGFSAESHLPFNSVFTFGLNSDHTSSDAINSTLATTNTTYDAQFKQPLGKLPLSANLKGHFEELSTPGVPTGRMPTLEQSLTWKPLQDTTVQMGLRQQQYQEYPGIDNQFNAAVFADWSQNLVNDISWHSYAELLNSHNLVDQAPASPITTGSNGTPQATAPSGSTTSLTSSLPVALEDQTFTFSTGPSIKIQKDLSASVEYSNRWDKNPAPGTIGQEQRVSLSVKGSF